MRRVLGSEKEGAVAKIERVVDGRRILYLVICIYIQLITISEHPLCLNCILTLVLTIKYIRLACCEQKVGVCDFLRSQK